MAPEDAARLDLQGGDAVLLRSDVGEFRGKVKLVPLKARNLQVHWPEGTALIRSGICDPACGIPDYHAVVTVTRLGREGR